LAGEIQLKSLTLPMADGSNQKYVIPQAPDVSDDLASIKDSIAEPFDPTKAYSVGDYVLYEGDLYRFNYDHVGEWNKYIVTKTPISDCISVLSKAIAEPYSSSKIYNAGDMVWYDNKLYKYIVNNTTNVPAGSAGELTTINTEISSLKIARVGVTSSKDNTTGIVTYTLDKTQDNIYNALSNGYVVIINYKPNSVIPTNSSYESIDEVVISCNTALIVSRNLSSGSISLWNFGTPYFYREVPGNNKNDIYENNYMLFPLFITGGTQNSDGKRKYTLNNIYSVIADAFGYYKIMFFSSGRRLSNNLGDKYSINNTYDIYVITNCVNYTVTAKGLITGNTVSFTAADNSSYPISDYI